MSEVGVAELTWENGYVATHELGGILPTPQTKASWVRRDDTLESIVHQATSHNQDTKLAKTDHRQINVVTKKSPVVVASSDGKWGENLSQVEMALGFSRKRGWSDCSNQYDRNCNSSNQEVAEPSVCASASATYCRSMDKTMMTWDSLESCRSLKSKSAYEDSTDLDGRENQETKGEAIQSRSTRRSRVAAVHNQSERKRRERINQKMKALQKLVPNASKTDKASMLDEVIMYLKQLQSQVQMMSMRNNVPQMAMPLVMQQQQQQQQQQQLQMALLSRMGMGSGLGMNMGMLDMNTMAQCLPPLIHPNSATAAAPSLVTPQFVSPQMIQRHIPPQATPTQGASNTSVPFSDPYSTFLAQSINMELYNKMAAYHQTQVAQALRSDKNSSQVQEQ